MDGVPRNQIDTLHRLKDLILSQIEAFYLTEKSESPKYSIWFSKDNGNKFVAQAVAFREKGKGVDCLFAGRSQDGFIGALENLWGLVLIHVSANAPSAGMVVG